ncbi:hypothetical protein DITRI_Ditri13aG0060100 [Diplodiscus trichospermus]
MDTLELTVAKFFASAKKKETHYEALHHAQESQLWGLALVLASQLGGQFYVDTLKQMTLPQLVAGFPLRTLCMLIVGQLAEEENLAVIIANRTKDDELVIIHLGDCLWKERSEITIAYTCYLVAKANFESYSDNSRLCLLGADPWEFPRTYASPKAIQRIELYEYSNVLGNSQSLETTSFIFEKRTRIHQQRGYTTNLAPAKSVGKLLNFFDSTAHRVVGGLPPSAPSASNGNSQVNDHFHQQTRSKVSAKQSTMAMSSLMSSASMESDGKMTMHNRSVSEPNFGRTPRQVDSSKEARSSTAQGKASGSLRASRFSRFGFGSLLFAEDCWFSLKASSR